MAYYRKDSKSWTASWSVNGKEYTKGGFTSRRIAEIYEAQRKIEKERGLIGLPKFCTLELKDLFSRFLKHQHARKKHKSYLRDEICVKQFGEFCEGKGIIYARQVDLDVLEKFREWKEKRVTPHGKFPSKRTINLYLKTVRLLFTYAQKTNLIEENPLEKLELIRLDKEELPRILTLDEVKLIEELSMGSVIEDQIKVLLRTGLRSQELCDLETRDIDFVNKKIIVRSSKSKARKTRYVPMLSSVEDIILRLYAVAQENKRTHLFVNSSGNPYTNTDLLHRLQPILKKASGKGVDISRVNVHTLRRTFISHMIMKGEDAIKVMNIVGHEEYSTMKKYLALTSQYLADMPELY